MGSSGNAGILDDLGNDFSQCFLSEHVIDVRNFLRNELVHDDSACGGFHHLCASLRIALVLRESHLDLGVECNRTLIESHDNLFRTIE